MIYRLKVYLRKSLSYEISDICEASSLLSVCIVHIAASVCT